MKLYVNAVPNHSPWGGGAKNTNAVWKLAPSMGAEIVQPNSMSVAPDVVLLVDLNPHCQYLSVEQAIMHKLMSESQGLSLKLVMRVNENDARKGTRGVDEYLLKMSQHVDGTIFVSKWLQSYFNDKGWSCKNQRVIYNGVDSDVFKSQPKLGNDKINIVTHHWSDNVMKGFDVYEKIDEFVGRHPEYTFTYIGRDRRTFKNTKVIAPLDAKKLGEELGKYDVYVSASRFDPAPNHVLEALSAGLPTYVHVDGGGAVELAGPDHALDSWKQFEDVLLSKKFINNNAFSLSSWQESVKQCILFLEETCQSKANIERGSAHS